MINLSGKNPFPKAQDITGRFTIEAPLDNAVSIDFTGATVRMIGKLEKRDSDAEALFNLTNNSGLTVNYTSTTRLDIVFVIPASATVNIPDPIDEKIDLVGSVIGEINVKYANNQYPVLVETFSFQLRRRFQTSY